jgi:hypothetical protein
MLQYKLFRGFNEIPEIEFNLVSVEVQVAERALRAQWTPELAQDIMAFHPIDAEAELTALLSEEISRELDREIIFALTSSVNKFKFMRGYVKF